MENIKSIFKDDINRKINGVVKVDQEDATTEREVSEYVVTKELKKHFVQFFTYYSDTFDNPTDDIGVWISGFFGSGKSHFLKMLSYILRNKKINGIKTVERFRDKFADDPGTFMLIDKATKNKTDTILFNIDIQSSIDKDSTAVIRVFAKMFYEHLGFYGENLKVAKLEQFISKKGKYEEFKKVFEEKNGSSWVGSRDTFDFVEDEIIATLNQVLGMSEESARDWFNHGKVETSIEQLVKEIKEYADSQGQNYRLLFMADEVGQYVGTDTNLLLNLQSLVEKIGSECHGKVWVICTGQQAIDEVIKVRSDEFSRIQARFKTRLSLSSSSADEVIQKRILKKTPEAHANLEGLYSKNGVALKNLFSFKDALSDITGFGNEGDFTKDYPFIPYQFIILQKVFTEIRKHGNSGKHLSGGERSMLSGFQEAAQKIQNQQIGALAPFYLFYDTVHTFLDSTIRNVIDRAQKAADNENGLESFDVDVLKLLYLVRYIGLDIPSNIVNLTILCADSINMEPISKKKTLTASLERLIKQNYVARTGDTYMFLTDEEQDVQSEINRMDVDSTRVVHCLGEQIFGNILPYRKFRVGKKDFDMEFSIDSIIKGSPGGELKLKFLSVVADPSEKDEKQLYNSSVNCVVGVLGQASYYEPMEHAMKIRKYASRKNVSQLPKSMQDIIKNQNNEAEKLEHEATDALRFALETATYYVHGEKMQDSVKEAKPRCDAALNYLVEHLFSKIGLVSVDFESDADVQAILKGNPNQLFDLTNAASEVEEFLEIRDMHKISTNMGDVQSYFQNIPYGWREIDVAAVVANLIYNQKVTIKYGGVSIQPDNPKLVELLRKKSEVGKTVISKRQNISSTDMNKAKSLLREYFDQMDIPDDEDGLIKFITDKFEEQKSDFATKNAYYNTGLSYPDQDLIQQALSIVNDILSQRADNTALIKRLLARENDLLDSKDDLVNITGFFTNQKALFDSSFEYIQAIASDMIYLESNQDAVTAYNDMVKILTVKDGERFNYSKIPSLNRLKEKVEAVHAKVLVEKKEELTQIASDCLGAIHREGMKDDLKTKNIVTDSDNFYTTAKAQIKAQVSIAMLDAMVQQLTTKKDVMLERIQNVLNPEPKEATPKPMKSVNKQVLFPSASIMNENDVDTYINKIREELLKLVRDNGGVKLN